MPALPVLLAAMSVHRSATRLVGRVQLVWTVLMDINGYELHSLAFMGASGPLWATTTPDGRPALVALRAGDQAEPLIQRWHLWSTVDSPHVASLIDVVSHEDGRWAVVVERIDGEPLDSLLARGALRTRQERDRVVQGVRRGVAALHAVGLVHGDVSPANVIVRPDGEAVLVDLVDDPVWSLGTPGWSDGGAGGTQADVQACDRLEERLSEAGAGTEHGAGHGSSVPEVLRRVATSPPTVREDAPPRHRVHRAGGSARTRTWYRRASRRSLAVAVVGAAALAAAVVLVPRILSGPIDQGVAAPMSGGPDRSPNASCPTPAHIHDALVDLVLARDRAIEARDAEAITAVSTSTVAEADRQVVAGLLESGIVVEGLSTTVGPVDEVTCDETAVSAVTTFQQGAHRRCTASGSCQDIAAQAVHSVRVVVSQEPWRVLFVEELGPR